jgi:hypothetical protein
VIAWTIGGVVLVYLILLASRLLQSPTSDAQNRSLAILARDDDGIDPGHAPRR